MTVHLLFCDHELWAFITTTIAGKLSVSCAQQNVLHREQDSCRTSLHLWYKHGAFNVDSTSAFSVRRSQVSGQLLLIQTSSAHVNCGSHLTSC